MAKKLDFPKTERTARRNVTAFRIHYADGEVLEGNYASEWVKAPIKDVNAVEFFYDEWKDGKPKRTYHYQQGEYLHPELDFGGKPGTNTPKRLTTKLANDDFDIPRSIGHAGKEDEHIQPLETMKGA